MGLGMSLAIALAAGAPDTAAAADPQPSAGAYGPEVPAPPKVETKSSEPSCAAQAAANPNAIVVCAPRPQGYRLDRDVMEARRDKKRQDAGRPTAHGDLPNDGCKVGPRGCVGGGVNLIGVALTAAEMAARISRGQEIGSMFVTDPQKSEYELYVEAKKRREAEAAAATKTPATAGP